MANERQGCGVSLRRLQMAGAEIGSWRIHQGTADRFRHGFPARPDTKKASLRLRQTRLPKSSQQGRHVYVFADAFNVHAHRDTAGDRHHRPRSGMGQTEFDACVLGQRWFTVRTQGKPDLRGRYTRTLRQNEAQSRPRPDPMRAVGLKAEASSSYFFVRRQDGFATTFE